MEKKQSQSQQQQQGQGQGQGQGNGGSNGEWETVFESVSYSTIAADVIRIKQTTDRFGGTGFQLACETQEIVRDDKVPGGWRVEAQMHVISSKVEVPLGQCMLVRAFGAKQSRNVQTGKKGRLKAINEVVGVVASAPAKK